MSDRAGTWRRIAGAVGLTLLAIVIVTNIPDNPFVTWTRHRALGQVVSHTAVGLLAIAFYPSLHALSRVRQARPVPLLTRLAVVLLGAAGLMLGLGVAAPRTMHGLLTREWGVVEPLQFAACGVGALICRAAGRTLHSGDPRRPLYRAGALVLTVMMLEEIDYLGLGAFALSLLGVKRGRIADIYVGTLHDLVNLAVEYSVVALVPLIALLVLALRWGRRHAAVLLAELRSWTSLPLAPAAVLMALAQADDIVGFAGLPSGREGVGLAFEEPLELLALVCLDASLVFKCARDTRPPVDGASAELGKISSSA